MVLRLRGGGGNNKTIALTIRPRIQKDKWSLYWKESMSTKTDCLDELKLKVDPAATTPDQLLALVAKEKGWSSSQDLLRLEGFNDPWERVIFQGRELKAGASLAEQGVGDGAVVTTVRRQLIADGWKVGSCIITITMNGSKN